MKTRIWRMAAALLFAAAAAGIMVLIYSFSAQQGSASASLSQAVSASLKHDAAQLLSLYPQSLTWAEKLELRLIPYLPDGMNWQMAVRKLAHFLLYFTLALVLYITCWIAGMKPGTRFVIVLALALIFALFDELHQSNVAGRVMSKKDVAIDMAGALSAVCGMWLISWLCSGVRKLLRS